MFKNQDNLVDFWNEKVSFMLFYLDFQYDIVRGQSNLTF